MSFRQRYILSFKTKHIDEKSRLLCEIPRRSESRSVGMTFVNQNYTEHVTHYKRHRTIKVNRVHYKFSNRTLNGVGGQVFLLIAQGKRIID